MRQLSLYQLQYRFMEGLIGGLQCILSQSVDLPEASTVLQCQSQSHLPRPVPVYSAKPPSHLSPVKRLVRVQSRRFCLLTFALSFVCCFSQVDLLCVSLSRLFQRLPLIFLSRGGDPRNTIHFLHSSNLVISPCCLRVCHHLLPNLPLSCFSLGREKGVE